MRLYSIILANTVLFTPVCLLLHLLDRSSREGHIALCEIVNCRIDRQQDALNLGIRLYRLLALTFQPARTRVPCFCQMFFGKRSEQSEIGVTLSHSPMDENPNSQVNGMLPRNKQKLKKTK